MNIAILLPVFNHLDYTKSTLGELSGRFRQLDGADFYIVLVDDGSTDGTSEWVGQNHPEVVLLEGDGNLWWSGAINLGAKHAIQELKADYLVLWNNDIRIEENYFSELLRIISEADQKAVLGSKILVAEQPGTVWSMGGYFEPRTGKYDMYGYFKEDSEAYNRVREVDWLTGMGTIVPREVVEKIGYWDAENFPQYHGDCDFTYRAMLAGYSLQVQPSLKMFNHVDNSGIVHQGSLRSLIRLLTDIRSKSNVKKNLKFYRLYAKSPRAYLPLIWLYFQIIGGFIKWKILNLFGIRKKTVS